MTVRVAVTKVLPAAVILIENLCVIDRAKQRRIRVLKQCCAARTSWTNVVSGALAGANSTVQHFSARRSAHCTQQMVALDGRFAVVRIDQITLLRVTKSGTIHAEQITGCVQCVTKSVKLAGSAEWRPHIWRCPRCRSFPMHYMETGFLARFRPLLPVVPARFAAVRPIPPVNRRDFLPESANPACLRCAQQSLPSSRAPFRTARSSRRSSVLRCNLLLATHRRAILRQICYAVLNGIAAGCVPCANGVPLTPNSTTRPVDQSTVSAQRENRKVVFIECHSSVYRGFRKFQHYNSTGGGGCLRGFDQKMGESDQFYAKKCFFVWNAPFAQQLNGKNFIANDV